MNKFLKTKRGILMSNNVNHIKLMRIKLIQNLMHMIYVIKLAKNL